jgi:hypothetical protein
VVTQGMRRAPTRAPVPEPVAAEIARKSRPDRDRTSAAPPGASPS